MKHFRLSRFPFRQQPDPEVFFVEAGRDEVLQNLCADVADGKTLIKLTGSDGTGKTLLHLLLARKLGIKKFVVIRLDHPVGSFEDLLRIIHRSLSESRAQGQDEVDPAQTRYLPEVLTLLRDRNRTGHRVVLLIDEAEQLFPATLERLVRLLAEIGREQLLQVLLIGRPELDRNLQQLSSYCGQVDLHAGYALVPMDLQETARYLRFRLIQAGSLADKAREIFTDEAISALYREARGNLSLTNLYAEQALVKAYEAGMFQVGADLISPRKGRTRDQFQDLAPLKTLLRKYRLPIIAGSCLVLMLLLVGLWPQKEEGAPPVPTGEKEILVEKKKPVAKVGEKKAPIVKAQDKNHPVQNTVNPPPAKEKRPVASPIPSPPPVVKNGGAARPVVQEVSPKGPGQPAPQIERNPAVAVSAPSPPDEVPSQVVPAPVVAAPSPGPPAAEERRTAAAPPPEVGKTVVLQADARKRKVAEATNGKRLTAKAVRDPEQLFAERIRVSSKWQSRSGYTIQLMVLASDTAEENFKGLLAQDRYAAVKDHLYVVRKSVPPTLFVYYGFFETMEAARLERDRLPDFLRKNQPYPLTIDQALKKARN